jgi:hypothetical protein
VQGIDDELTRIQDAFNILESHTHPRGEIPDFFDSPFWSNIPDRPSTFPPDSHQHTRGDISDFWGSPFWNNIPDKPSTFPPESHTHPGSEITSQVSDADKVDGYDLDQDVRTSASPSFAGLSLQGALEMGDNFVKRGILLDSRDYYNYGLSLEDNVLALAVEKGYTVTASKSPDAGFLKYMFTSSFPNYAKWDDSLTTYPLTITIEDFGTIHYSTYFWIHFAWNRKPDSGYKIEVYTSNDASWHTVADTTSAFQTNVHFYSDSYITKLRITIKSGNSTYGAIQIGQIGFAARYRYRRDYGWLLSKEGDTMYGDLTMASGKKIYFGSYYLDSLIGNNKVPDSDKLDGYHASDFALASQAIPSGMIAIFQGSCPSGWTRVADFDGKFLRGAATYGGTGGSSTHTHTIDPPSTNTSGIVSDDWYYQDATSGDQDISWRHHHTVDIAAFSSGSASHLPPYIDVVFCKKD